MVKVSSAVRTIAAAMLTLISVTSCHTGIDSRRHNLKELSFTATKDIALDLTADRKEDADRTRAALGQDGSVLWTSDDSILLFTSGGDKYKLDCEEINDGGRSAVFRGEVPLVDSYYALYPSQADAVFDSKEGTVTAEIPCVQNATAGCFDPAASLAVAYTTDTGLNFRNVGALVSFVVRDQNIVSISLSGKSGSQTSLMAGCSEILFNDGEPVAELVNGTGSVTLKGDFTKDQRYYMVLYPGTYENLQLVFTDASGRTATFSNPVALTLERNDNVNLFDQEIPEAKWLAPSVSMASTIEVEADGASVESTPVTLTAADGWSVDVTYDGCVEYAYFDTQVEEVVYNVARNTTSQERTGTITVTISHDGFESVSATANVIQEAGAAPVADNKWYLVTSAAGLVASDEYLIACNSEGVVATDFASGAVVLGYTAATFSSDKSYIEVLPEKAMIFTLGGTTDAWTLEDANGLKLGAKDVKKLIWGDGVTTWQITVSGSGSATIQSTKSTYGKMQYNSSAPRFTTYSSGQSAVQLYHRSGQSVTSVTTGSAASMITSSSANVSASYHCVSATPSEAGFLYGVDPSALSERVRASAPSSLTQNYEVMLSGLFASTTYYYKAYVIENGSTYYGTIRNFTTNPSGGVAPSGGADYLWPELPAQTDKDRNGIDDGNPDYYYSHTFRADASSIRNFSCCYSKSRIHPVWVAAPMHQSYLGGSGRNDSYRADPNIKCTQNGKFDGYTRGHMVGSSDRTVSVATNKQAFYYSNIGAQLSAGFNTGGGVWNNLEDRVDGYLCKDTLYQVIGCIFDPFTDHYGQSQGKRTASGSDIPTAYYKALLRTKSGTTGKNVRNCSADELQCVAFIVIHNSSNKGRKPSSKDMYSIAELEALTGLTFFVNVPNAPKSTFKASDWGM